jgi:amino acid transporter
MKSAGKRSRQINSVALSGFLQLGLTFIAYLVFIHTAGLNFVIAASNGFFPVAVSPFYSFFAAIAAGGVVVTVLLALSFAVTPASNAYGNLIMIQRVPFALAFDGLLPRSFARVSNRTHTPVAVHTATALLCVAGLAWAVYSTSFVTVLTYVSLLTVPSVLVGGLAAVAMPLRHRELYKNSPANWRVLGVPVLPVVGVGCIFDAALFFYIVAHWHTNVGIKHAWVPFAIIGGVFLAGAALYYGARAAQRARGIDLELTFKTIPAE